MCTLSSCKFLEGFRVKSHIIFSQIFMYNLFFVSCSVCSDFMLYNFYLFFAHVEIPTLLISIVFLSISLCKMDNFRCQDTITDLTFPTSSCELVLLPLARML